MVEGFVRECAFTFLNRLVGLRDEFELQAQSEDLGQRLFGEEAAKGVSLVEGLGRKYNVVVMNPPYAGSKNLSERLKKFVEREYKEGKRARYASGLIARLRAEQERARPAGKTAEVSSLQFKIEDVEELRSRMEKIERGDELTYRIRCRWKAETETGRPGLYAPDIDDGVKVNLRPFQEAGLLAVKEVIKKW